jgi:hypothetical protein
LDAGEARFAGRWLASVRTIKQVTKKTNVLDAVVDVVIGPGIVLVDLTPKILGV